MVDALFRVPVELTGNVFVAFDDHEGALRIADDDVGERDLARGFALFKLEGPAGADADNGGEDRKEDNREEGHAILFDYGNDEDGNGHGATEDGEPGQGTEHCGLDGMSTRVLRNALAADRVCGEVLAIVKEVSNVVDMISDAAGASTENFACRWDEAFGARGSDKGLWCGEEPGKEEEG